MDGMRKTTNNLVGKVASKRDIRSVSLSFTIVALTRALVSAVMNLRVP